MLDSLGIHFSWNFLDIFQSVYGLVYVLGAATLIWYGGKIMIRFIRGKELIDFPKKETPKTEMPTESRNSTQTKRYQNPRDHQLTPEGAAALYQYLVRAGQIKDDPPMSEAEALAYFREADSSEKQEKRMVEPSDIYRSRESAGAMLDHLEKIGQIKPDPEARKKALDKYYPPTKEERTQRLKDEINAALREEKEYQDTFYLNEEEQKTRRIAFVHCEDEGCGFLVEFKHPNSTFFCCKDHGTGINLDLASVPAAGVKCELHGEMERYNLLKDDNVCPRCEASTLAILSVGRSEDE